MDDHTRPLWQLLLLARDSKEAIPLTCEECFGLLEYDAELLAAGANFAEIRAIVDRHLELCSSCKAQLGKWLEKLAGEENADT